MSIKNVTLIPSTYFLFFFLSINIFIALSTYIQSLGLLGSIPAAALIISLFCLLLYLMSRCCDRKPRPAHSITSLKVTLSIVTVLCCAAIGLGKFNKNFSTT